VIVCALSMTRTARRIFTRSSCDRSFFQEVGPAAQDVLAPGVGAATLLVALRHERQQAERRDADDPLARISPRAVAALRRGEVVETGADRLFSPPVERAVGQRDVSRVLRRGLGRGAEEQGQQQKGRSHGHLV
jgi:hypothetical protein